MGKLLQPFDSLKVECSVVVKPDLAKETAEYLEAFSDTYGESPVPNVASISLEEPTISPSRKHSRGFARVIRRQSSMSMRNLASFGDDITPRGEGNRKTLLDEED